MAFGVRRAFYATLGCVLLLAAGQAYAQTSPSSQPHTPASTEAGDTNQETLELEQVTVTASRREMPLRGLSVSVYPMTGQDLEEMGAASFLDYAGFMPGLSFGENGLGGQKHVIRGISSDTIAEEVNAATAMFLDDVPITPAVGANTLYAPDPFLVDIQRIEVLRGPQGTLFGSHAMGGATRIITNSPDPLLREGFVEVAPARIQDGGSGYELRGMVNVPFANNRAAVRAVGYVRDADGYVDDPTKGRYDLNTDEIVGGRLAVTRELSDRITVTGKLAYQERKSEGSSTDDVDEPSRMQSRLFEEPARDEWAIGHLVVDVDLGWGDFVSSTSYFDRVVDQWFDLSEIFERAFEFQNPMANHVHLISRELVQEARVFTTNGNRVNWLAGVFYQDQELDSQQTWPVPGFDEATDGLASMHGLPDMLLLSDVDRSMEQLALYGEVSYRLTESTELAFGNRWYDIDRSSDIRSTGLSVGGPSASQGAAGESGSTPRLSLTYAPDSGPTVYGNIAKGFRPGGVSPPEGFAEVCEEDLRRAGYSEWPISYETDSLWSYEIGSRARLLDGLLYFTGAAYHIDWSDMQTQKIMDCGGAFVENVGKATSDGLELTFDTARIGNAAFSLMLTYTDAELAEDVPNLGGRKGEPIPGVPELAGSLRFNYTLRQLGQFEPVLFAEYRHVGDRYDVFDADARNKMPAYDVTDLRLSLFGEHLTVTAFVENVFDEQGVLTRADWAVGDWVTTVRPRTIGVRARWTY